MSQEGVNEKGGVEIGENAIGGVGGGGGVNTFDFLSSQFFRFISYYYIRKILNCRYVSNKHNFTVTSLILKWLVKFSKKWNTPVYIETGEYPNSFCNFLSSTLRIRVCKFLT